MASALLTLVVTAEKTETPFWHANSERWKDKQWWVTETKLNGYPIYSAMLVADDEEQAVQRGGEVFAGRLADRMGDE